MTEVEVKDVTAGSDSTGRAVWKVNAQGSVTEPGQGQASVSAMWLDVDTVRGLVSIPAQG